MTPDEWLADFEAKTAELQRNAAAFRRASSSGAQDGISSTSRPRFAKTAARSGLAANRLSSDPSNGWDAS